MAGLVSFGLGNLTYNLTSIILLNCKTFAGVAEQADARDSKSRGEILVGSIPTSGIDYNTIHYDVLGRCNFAHRVR